MTDKKLSLDEVIAIRKKWNPNKAFAHGYKHGDLENKTYSELVDIFNKRISEWYFDTVELLPQKVTHYNFPITIFCCVIIDLLSQYIYCAPAHRANYFTQFFRDYLPEFSGEIKPLIISCEFKENNWHELKIKDIPSAFYYCFRNGVVHSGRILEYGRINEIYPTEIIKVVEWKEGEREIYVHTTGLLKRLREIYDWYITELKGNNTKLKPNFINKFKLEYGIEIR